jgi:metalloendopeptidase OMA1, mitochondrial
VDHKLAACGYEKTMTARPNLKRRWLFVTLVLLAGCGYTPSGDGDGRRGEGPGGREQPLALSPAEELNVGRRAYREVLGEFRDRALPSSDQRAVLVRQIVDRLARASEIEPLQREINLRLRGYTFEWEVTVVRERQANAFCLPAGKMVVFTGIMQVAENEDQLATVLAHEMAHALAHHGSERVARENTAGGILGNKNYDRYQESEADKIGLFLMPFAGYDPDAAVRFWERMQRLSRGGEPPEILSDHPSHQTRIKQLRAWAPQAKAAKKAFDEGRVLK